jgi:tetratricopeptide (TPR) repeat protein
MRAIIEKINILRKSKKYDEVIELINSEEYDEELKQILVDVYMEIQNVEKAIEIMNEIISKNEDKKNLIKRSVLLFKNNDKVRALEDVEKAYEMDKNDPNIIKGIIDVNASLGNYEKSLDFLEDLSKNPNFNDSNLHERRRNLINMIKTREESDSYLYLIGIIKALTKNEDKIFIAQKMFEQMQDKKDEKYYETGAMIYRKINNTKKIIEICEEAVGKGEMYVNDKIYKALAFSYVDNGELKKAIKVYNEILKKYTGDKDLYGIYADMSFAYYNLEENEKALELINKAIKLMPNKDTLYIRKGDILARVKGIEIAIKEYERAIELNPMNKEAYDRKENAIAIMYRKGRNIEEKGIFR